MWYIKGFYLDSAIWWDGSDFSSDKEKRYGFGDRNDAIATQRKLVSDVEASPHQVDWIGIVR
jgi:hypothetical protein